MCSEGALNGLVECVVFVVIGGGIKQKVERVHSLESGHALSGAGIQRRGSSFSGEWSYPQ